MGACYSRKAGGGKYAYSTVQMASTKLDDSSRLARPTPYARNSVPSPSVFVSRKGIPIPTKQDRSPRMGRHINNPSDVKTPKNSPVQPLQSSIPRFSSNPSSIPMKAELNENIVNANNIKNENNQLHMVNNNTVSNSPLLIDSQEKQANTFSVKHTKSDKLNLGSKSCPDNMQAKADEKLLSRIPAKLNSQHVMTPPRSQLSQTKSSYSVSHLNSELHSDFKRPSHSSDKRSICSSISPDCNSKNSSGDSPNEFEVSKISNITVESHESIIDFDSGIGSSFIEKTKPEDSDTLKDIERLESCDTSPVSVTDREQLSSSMNDDSKNPKFCQQQGLKCPLYKRGMNGKWTVDDKNFSSEKRNSQVNGENIFKINMPSNSFSTYASYKGFMSYKKCPNNQDNEWSSKSLDEKANNSKNIAKDFYSPNMKTSIKGKNNSSQAKKNQKPNDIEVSKTSTPSSPNSKSISGDSDDKSDCLGSDTKSPVSELENREFLIDDEISDQPELVCSFVSGKLSESPVPSLRQSVTELHALQLSSTSKKPIDASNSKSRRERLGSDHRDSSHFCSELGSSCSSIASDDLMMDFEKRMDFPDGTVNEGMASPMRKMSDVQAIEDQLSSLVFSKPKVDLEERTRKRVLRRSSASLMQGGSAGKEEWRLRSISLPLRPPRPMSVSEADDGSIILDSSSYRLLSQDLNGVKTLLLRLKSVIQEAETINPFDQNIFFQSLVHSDFPLNSTLLNEKNKEPNQISKSAGLSIENADLRRQIVLLQQQLEEKDRTILLLQQQMTKYSNVPRYNDGITQSSNAATQTERPRSLTSSLTPSLNNSSETLVSVQDISEECWKES